jgi:hypothetical protein
MHGAIGRLLLLPPTAVSVLVRPGYSGTSSYAAPPARFVLPPSAHWPASDLSRAQWAVVYTCGCGDWSCGLLARNDADDRVVIWSDFQTPFSIDWMLEHPGEPVEGDISRAGFGPFRFDRLQYEVALRNPERVPWPHEQRRDGDGLRA